MRLVLHPKVYSDIDEIMGYYERIGTAELADEFYAELRHYMRQAAERPESFPIRERDLRRVQPILQGIAAARDTGCAGVEPSGSSRSKPSGVLSSPGAVPGFPVMP